MEAKFVCFLEIIGVGYKAFTDGEGRKLTLRVGFSHDIELQAPLGARVFCPRSIYSYLLHRRVCAGSKPIAARIKRCKPPEIYKGKGIRYRNEIIIQKQGKKK
jgi:large subunit ribosomal protein L6